jgi:HK97 family phage major capsid protein
MTAVYNTGITRDGSNDPLVPTPVSAQIIQELPQSSAALRLCRTVPLSTKSSRTPVLSALPTAYWVTGDTGLKQTSSQDWSNVDLVAEELAVIVPVPEAYLDDAQVPVWDEVRPRIAEAFGAALDAAVFFGTNKPGTFGTAIYPHTLATGNVVVRGASSTVLSQNIAAAGEAVALDGFAINGFVARPGFGWNLIGQVSATEKMPIFSYGDGLPSGRPSTLYGQPYFEALNGAWDASEAELIGGDFSKAIIGLRQDLTFKVFTEGVISDDEGAVVLNLMQQDSVALRAVMRVAYALANPVTVLNGTAGTRSPFYTIQATTANS